MQFHSTPTLVVVDNFLYHSTRFISLFLPSESVQPFRTRRSICGGIIECGCDKSWVSPCSECENIGTVRSSARDSFENVKQTETRKAYPSN